MMKLGRKLRVAIAATGKVNVEGVIEAVKAEGWDVSVLDSLERLQDMAVSERCDAALITADAPQELPANAVRELLGHVSELPVFFLFPPGYDVAECLATLGLTSDQVWGLDTPPVQLKDAVRHEVQCALDNRPEYVVMCVDDDPEFLASMRELLVPNLTKAFSRLALDVQFFVNPREALAEARSLRKRIATIICDQVMPEMQGLELLERIKGLCPGTQRVLLTGYAGLESAIRAVNDRLLDKYLTKPIEEPVDFVNIVEHLIREYHLQLTATAQRQRFMAQLEFIRTITAAASRDKVLNATTRFLLRQLRAVWTAIFLWDADRFVLGTSAGHPPHLTPETCLAFLTDLERRAGGLRLPYLPRPPEEAPPLTQDCSALLSTVVVPLKMGPALLGVILVGVGQSDRRLSRDERLLVSFVADVTTITVGRFNDHDALEGYYVGTMASLMDVVEAKDHYTRGHTERVVELALALGKAVGMSEAELKNLQYAAALHDLGKLAVPEGILRKPGRLAPSECAIIKEHPARADTILSHLRFFDSARMIIRSHHERCDGKGYPDGLAGEEIPLGGRILAIVDSYDAMTSTRPYRKAMTSAGALKEIRAGAGTQFDPRLAAVFAEMMEKRGITEKALHENSSELTEAKRS